MPPKSGGLRGSNFRNNFEQLCVEDVNGTTRPGFTPATKIAHCIRVVGWMIPPKKSPDRVAPALQYAITGKAIREVMIDKKWQRLWVAASVICLISACTTSIVVVGRVPTPLVSRVPAKVAVYYTEQFKSFVHTESLPGADNWRIDIGQQNLAFFRNLLIAMFDTVEEVASSDLNQQQWAEYDALIIPTIDKYGFLTPNTSGLDFFSASLTYNIKMTDARGVEIIDYRVVGYGKSEGGIFSFGKALIKATMKAIRDGGTRISTELKQQKGFADWASELPGAQSQ